MQEKILSSLDKNLDSASEHVKAFNNATTKKQKLSALKNVFVYWGKIEQCQELLAFADSSALKNWLVGSEDKRLEVALFVFEHQHFI